ncbi:HAD family hydrolase [Kitasatospora sp. NPDC006697]|uniref:HAD family hydrolase n=1 Tax=Kitasatospora sp. NPDC006697 TaxID=3364020 RepID=UPI00369C77E1
MTGAPVLLLDLDDTLIPDVPAARRAIADTLGSLGSLGLPATAEAVDGVLAAVRRVWRAEPARRHPALAQVSSWESLWVDYGTLDELPERVRERLLRHDERAWAAALHQLSADARSAPEASDGSHGSDAAEAAARFRHRRAELTRPLPGVPAHLDRLAARHELWLVTQGCRTLQRRKLALSGLAPRFARVFVSGELGYEKADPLFAELLLSQLARTGRSVCQLVGDGTATDLLLASFGGWDALHICTPENCRDADRTGVRHALDLGGVTAHCDSLGH